MLALEVMYDPVDRVGMVPQLNEPFPCDEAPNGSLLVVEKAPILRAVAPWAGSRRASADQKPKQAQSPWAPTEGRDMMKAGDQVVSFPRESRGAPLTVRYRLPHQR